MYMIMNKGDEVSGAGRGSFAHYLSLFILVVRNIYRQSPLTKVAGVKIIKCVILLPFLPRIDFDEAEKHFCR